MPVFLRLLESQSSVKKLLFFSPQDGQKEEIE